MDKPRLTASVVAVAVAVALMTPMFFSGCLEGENNVPERRPPPCSSYGDVNNDSFVTDADCSIVDEHIVGNYHLTSEEFERADVDGDEDIDSLDAQYIAQYIEGNRDSFPVCT